MRPTLARERPHGPTPGPLEQGSVPTPPHEGSSDPGDDAALEGGAGRAGLLLGSPRQVLARIQRGDPLGLGPRCARAVTLRGLAPDPDRLHLRALAVVAREAARRGPLHSLDSFLEAAVQQALDDLLREEARDAARGDAPDPRSVVAVLARGCGLEPRALRDAQAAFHGQTPGSRRALVRVLIEGHDPERVASDEGVSLVEVLRRARRAALAVLRAAGGPTP